MNDDSTQQESNIGQSSPEEVHTAATFDSYEFSRVEAQEINRSMDMSMEFWGHVRDTSGIISATRLKCVGEKPTRQTEMARVIWNKMTEEDLEILKKVEGILMKTGEITIEQLFEAMEKISEKINYSFQDMFPEYCNDDIINSAVSIMNELLYIYNQNEPPEIAVDEDYFPSINSCIGFIPLKIDKPPPPPGPKNAECQEIVDKMNRLIKKARKHGIEDIRVPSSAYLSEQSKLLIIEKQVNAKIRLQKLNQAISQNLSNQNEKRTHLARRDINRTRETVQNKPAFRTSVKPRPVEYSSIVKNAPNLQMRMKRTRKKLIETQMKNDIFEGNSSLGQHVKQVSYARIYDNVKTIRGVYSKNSSKEAFPVKTQFKTSPHSESAGPDDRILQSKKTNISKKSSREIVNSAQTNLMESSKDLIHLLDPRNSKKQVSQNMPLESNESLKYSQDIQSSTNRDEMKTVLQEVLKEVGQASTSSKEEQAFTTNNAFQPPLYSKFNDAEPSEMVSQLDETEMKVDIQRLVNDEVDTLDISVTQDSMNPLLWPLSRDHDRTVTTEISVSSFTPGPAVRLSLTNRVKSEEEGLSKLAKERPERVQEAVNYLNELLGSTAQDRKSLNKENEEKQEEIINHIDLNVKKLEVSSVKAERNILERQGHMEPEETVQTVNVNMAMVVEDFRLGQMWGNDARACRHFQMTVGEEPPRVQEEIGDGGSAVWSSWSRQGSFSNSSMDSLYVNVDRKNLELSDSETGYMSTASSSTTDASDKRKSTLMKDGGPSIFSLCHHQQAEALNNPQEQHTAGNENIRLHLCTKEKEFHQNQESEEESSGQETKNLELKHSLDSGKQKRKISSGDKIHMDNSGYKNHNISYDLNEKELSLFQNIEISERELQQILQHEERAYEQSLLIEEQALRESLVNRRRELEQTLELKARELQNEEQGLIKNFKRKDKGLNESLVEKQNPKHKLKTKSVRPKDGEPLSCESSAEEEMEVSTSPRPVARKSLLRFLWLPFWIMFGVIVWPITGPYTLLSKVFSGVFRARDPNIEPTGDIPTTSSES